MNTAMKKIFLILFGLLLFPAVGHAVEADNYCLNTGTQPPQFVPCGVGNPLQVTIAPPQNGLSVFSEIVPNNHTSVAIKASAGQLYGLQVFNNSATIAYVKLYNAAQGSTTCGSGTPVSRYMIPASSGFIYPENNGLAFSTAITVCVTTGIADNDTGDPTASVYLLNVTYK